MKRWIMRILFAALSAWMLHSLITDPYTTDAPVLSRSEDLPLTWAATPDVLSLTAPQADLPSPAVDEPEPEPEPEPAEPGDIFGIMYHDLTTDLSQTSVWRTTPDCMRDDLETFAELGYLPLSIEDYITGDYEIGPDYYIVTFDDGYTSNLTMAQPLLREMGVPAVVFVITDSVGIQGHMSWDELRELQEGGVFTIYSHTHTHAYAENMTTDKFIADEKKAWGLLEENLGELPYKILSYPGGAYTRATMKKLAADGYQMFTIQNNPWWYDPDNTEGIRYLRRFNVAYKADILELVELNREINGQCTIEEKFAAIAKAEAEALAAERAARRAWIEGKMEKIISEE